MEGCAAANVRASCGSPYTTHVAFTVTIQSRFCMYLRLQYSTLQTALRVPSAPEDKLTTIDKLTKPNRKHGRAPNSAAFFRGLIHLAPPPRRCVVLQITAGVHQSICALIPTLRIVFNYSGWSIMLNLRNSNVTQNISIW